MSDKMFWFDLETEGLDENEDAILEVACVVTDSQLNVLKKRRWSVKPGGGWSRRTLKAKSPFVYNMHDQSGLITDVVARGRHFTSIGFEVLGWVYNEGAEKTDPMCGSSIHFDRKFIKTNWPQVDALFSYRIIDVSSEKETMKRFRPEWAAEWAAIEDSRIKAHRALPDVLQSIEEFKFYRMKRGDL